jgi:cellulose synthase/poly-beta-1,6-N-acetylglucosamine synthase-like glycosyltransferase
MDSMTMQCLGSWFFLALVIAMALPVVVICLEVIAAVLLPQPHASKNAAKKGRPRAGVLIPAHNESSGLTATIESVKSQLCEGDRLLVVADNCTDDTSAVATSLGVEVINRQNPLKKGKGYALDWGIKHLILDPPEVLIIVDADCLFTEGSIDTLVRGCRDEHRPLQALNLMKAPEEFPETFQFAEFAWRVKNWVRPLGLRALHLPCQLTGTGMAFPWNVIRSANLASGEIVEDLKLGLELARAGKPALFCPSACVVSHFPTSQEGIDSQRQRWERGHLNMLVKVAPRMLREGIMNRDIRLFILALDLAVPPLSLLALIEIALLSVSMFTWWSGAPGTSFYVVLTTNILFALAVVLSWIYFGRDVMPARRLLTAPLFVGRKLWLYRRIVFGSGPQQWIRTDRSRSKPPPP